MRFKFRSFNFNVPNFPHVIDLPSALQDFGLRSWTRVKRQNNLSHQLSLSPSASCLLLGYRVNAVFIIIMVSATAVPWPAWWPGAAAPQPAPPAGDHKYKGHIKQNDPKLCDTTRHALLRPRNGAIN